MFSQCIVIVNLTMVISNVTQMVGMIGRGVAMVIGMAIVVIVRAFTTTTTA